MNYTSKKDEGRKKLTNEKKLDSAYRRMATDKEREIDAQEWSDALVADPDVGLVLTAHAKKRLQQSVKSKQKGNYKSLNEIKKKYNL